VGLFLILASGSNPVNVGFDQCYLSRHRSSKSEGHKVCRARSNQDKGLQIATTTAGALQSSRGRGFSLAVNQDAISELMRDHCERRHRSECLKKLKAFLFFFTLALFALFFFLSIGNAHFDCGSVAAQDASHFRKLWPVGNARDQFGKFMPRLAPIQ
jgi:hypothetical protein